PAGPRREPPSPARRSSVRAALVRRERAVAVRLVDAVAADGLRVHTRAHQRDESLRLMALQAEAVPALVERVDAMMAALGRQAEAERKSTRLNSTHEETSCA